MASEPTITLCRPEVEAALIGAAFLDPALFLTTASPRDFGMESFRELWICCQGLVRQGLTPDAVTVAEDILPGGWTVAQFVERCPTVTGADDWLKIMRSLTRRRELQAAGQDLVRAAHEEDTDRRQGLMELYNAHLEAATEPTGKRVYSASELLADPSPLPADVVQGFIPGQIAALLSGPGGDGKSYAMLDLAVAVARGNPWLTLDVAQTPVLIIDLENRRNRIERRLEETLRGHGLLEDPPPVHFAFEVGLHLDCDEAVLEYAQMAQDVGAGLIILDSLVDFLGETDENSNPEMGAVARRLRKLVDFAGVSVLAIHHTPKSGDGPRGATALRNGVDVNIMISRDGNVLRMQQDKNRVGPEQTVVCRMNWGAGLFNLSPIGVTVGRRREAGDPDEGAILDYLEDGEWYSSNEVVRAVMQESGHARSTVHGKLKGMVDDGMLETQDQDSGTSYQVRKHPEEDQDMPYWAT